jgi:hypothetical protein
MITGKKITLKPFIETHPMSEAPRLLQGVADHEFRKRVILTPDWDA